MFQERPYRQQRHSVWSIWWFVGLMGAGLTAWHLELIPFLTSVPPQTQQMSGGFEEHALPFESDEMMPAASLQEPALFSAADVDQMARDIQTIEAQKPIPEQTASAPQIQLAGYEAPSQVEEPTNTTQVQTLTYQPDLHPVPIRPLPPAQGLPPVQPADYQQTAAGQALPVMTASLNEQSQISRYDRQPAVPAGLETAGLETTGSVAAAPVSQELTRDPNFVLQPEAEQEIVRLRELSAQYWKQETMRAGTHPELLRLAENIYFQPTTHYLPGHVVQPGDQLRLIAKNYQVTWKYLSFLNNTEPEKIRVGQVLKVIQGPFGAVVDLSDRMMTVHAHGYYVCSFPVATGKDDATPTGEFVVLNKVENPTYYGQDGVIGADDPRNPLGEHWIDLGNGIGIHGTIDPNSIGQAVSKGCIRLQADDVAIVYDLLTVDSQVIIRP